MRSRVRSARSVPLQPVSASVTSSARAVTFRLQHGPTPVGQGHPVGQAVHGVRGAHEQLALGERGHATADRRGVAAVGPGEVGDPAWATVVEQGDDRVLRRGQGPAITGDRAGHLPEEHGEVVAQRGVLG